MTTARPASIAAPAPLQRLDLLAALGVVLIWGSNFVAMKTSLRDFTPFQLGAVRYLFAALPLVLLVKRPRLPARWLVYYGLAQGVGQFGLLFVALQAGMTAALASVVMQTQLFFTALLGVGLLGERIGGPLRAGLALAAVGLGCFALNFTGGGGAGGTTWAGLLLNLAAAAMWGVSNIVARKAQQAHPGYDATGFVVWSALVPIVPFVAMSWLFDPPAVRWQWLHAGPGAWLGAAYLGWIATVLAYAMWTGLLKRHPANRVAPFSLGVPVVGLAAGVGLLGERIAPWQWAGIGCVVLALATVMFGGRWRPRNSMLADPKRTAAAVATLHLGQTVEFGRPDYQPPPEPTSREASRDFRVGDKVTFDDGKGRGVVGVVTRIDRRTATIGEVDDRQWRVDFQLLRRVVDA